MSDSWQSYFWALRIVGTNMSRNKNDVMTFSTYLSTYVLYLVITMDVQLFGLCDYNIILFLFKLSKLKIQYSFIKLDYTQIQIFCISVNHRIKFKYLINTILLETCVFSSASQLIKTVYSTLIIFKIIRTNMKFTGLPLVFKKLFPDFLNFFQVFKNTCFCVIK